MNGLIRLMLQNQLKNNTQLNEVLQFVGQRDPKEVFYEECKKRNVNPDTIMNLLKN